MATRSNSSLDERTGLRSPPRTHGSSLHTHGTPLDQERAASMADEGGVSAAYADSLEQQIAVYEARSWRRWLPWAAAAAATVVGVAILTRFLSRR
jgi:hypothetical protein